MEVGNEFGGDEVAEFFTGSLIKSFSFPLFPPYKNINT